MLVSCSAHRVQIEVEKEEEARVYNEAGGRKKIMKKAEGKSS